MSQLKNFDLPSNYIPNNYIEKEVMSDQGGLFSWVATNISLAMPMGYSLREGCCFDSLIDQLCTVISEEMISHGMALCVDTLQVDYSCRGKGIGSGMLKSAIEKDGVASAILLCDTQEEQIKGFYLKKFYKNQGFFSILGDTTPFMVYPISVASSIRKKVDTILEDNLVIDNDFGLTLY